MALRRGVAGRTAQRLKDRLTGLPSRLRRSQSPGKYPGDDEGLGTKAVPPLFAAFEAGSDFAPVGLFERTAESG